MIRTSHFAWPAILLLLLTSCQTAAANSSGNYLPWVYADLRQIDQTGESDPGLDLVAAYTRSQGSDFQIRLDLLDLTGEERGDLYLAVDSLPGGSTQLPVDQEAKIAWEALVVVPAQGPIQVLDTRLRPLPGTGIRLLRDSIFDTLTLSLPRRSLPGNPSAQASLRLQAFTTEAGQPMMADSLGPLSSGSLPPPRARVILAFWNALPAYSPLEALRRWDGAHTGPLGGRHGLFNLLRAVRNTQQPVFLLDLKSPASLAALDFTGGTKLVQDLSSSGLLGLPEALPGLVTPDGQSVFTRTQAILEQSVASSYNTAASFGFNSDGFLFAPEGMWPDQSNQTAIFLPISPDQVIAAASTAEEDAFHFLPLASRTGRLLIPVPGYPGQKPAAEQATLQGPSLPLRLALVQAALQASPDQALVLGGDLPATTWGNPQIARATLRYFKEHPWIHVLGPQELLSIRPKAKAGWPEASFSEPGQGSLDLPAPASGSPQAAWQAYLALSSPTFPYHPDLPKLRREYIILVEGLEVAAEWSKAPYERAACEPSGICILASRDVYAHFESVSGNLVFLFVRTPSGIHQVIGPSAQFTTGQSDPSSWDLEAGLSADPAVIPGAFGALLTETMPRVLSPISIVFESSSDSRLYALLPNGIQVTATTSGPLHLQVPLVLDPWLRFSARWADQYAAQQLPDRWTWQAHISPSSDLRVSIRTEAQVSAATFKDSLPFMDRPEDPNRDYPPGHRLPFPMALLTIEGQDQITVIAEVEELNP